MAKGSRGKKATKSAEAPAKRPRRRSKYTLKKLLRGYKGSYPYRGVFDDPPVGRELI
jgi:hypothetical protein